jgi:hypothetical protein
MSKRTLPAAVLLLSIGGALAISAQDRAAADPTAEARLKLANEGYGIALKFFTEGRTDDPARLLLWSRRVMDAERDSGGDAAKAAQDHLDRLKTLEKIAEARRQAARGTYLEVLDLQFEVLEAEALLAKAKSGQPR